MAKRDHFDVLIVCPRESELQAARHVFEHETNSKFEGAHTDLPYNLRLCRGWNDLPLNVAMVAQVGSGHIECTKLVPDLAKHFTVGLIAMTGTCTGEEDKYRGIEYGTVVVGNRTTTECGGLEKEDGTVQSRVCYKELDKRLSPALNELVEMRESHKWSSYVPAVVYRASPRYVKELLLECVLDNEGISKRKLLTAVESKSLGLTKLDIDEVLDKLQKEQRPLIYAPQDKQWEYKSTNAGQLYANVQVKFPCEDKTFTVVFASIGSVFIETERLDMTKVRQRMGDHNIKAIDKEAHSFMEQATDRFSPGLAVVMKGISDYGTESSKLMYYEDYAAATPAAFLRHFITEKKSVISSRSLKAQLFDLRDIVCDKWRDLADRLNMSRYVEMIELEEHTKKERAFMMLRKWKSMVKDNATVEKVKAELKEIEEQKKEEAIASIVFPNELMEEKQFCGRHKELTILSNTMWGEKAPQVSTSLKFCCVVIKGMGGVGKSSLAAKYAFQCKHLYSDGVLYFNAESWATLTNSVIHNLTVLSLSSPSVSRSQSRFDELKSNPLQDNNAVLLNHIFKLSKMLLVYDGADDLSFLPKILPRSTARVHVLITTRCGDRSVLQKSLNHAHVISLGCLEVEDAVAAVAMWSGHQPSNSQETAAATKLSVEPPIEKLAIALAHAGTYMRKAHLSYEEYYKLLKRDEVELEALALDLDKLLHYFRASRLHEVLMEADVTQPSDLKRLSDKNIDELDISERDKNVVKDMDIELVARDNPKALSLLEYASFLSSRDIPEKLVRPLVFVEWHDTAKGYTLNIHPLVQSTVMERVKQQPDEFERKLTDVCNNMLSHLPQSEMDLDCLPSDIRLQLASHSYSLTKHVLLADVEVRTCLDLVRCTCVIFMQYQSPDTSCYLCEKWFHKVMQLHSLPLEVKCKWLIEARYLLGLAYLQKFKFKEALDLSLKTKKMIVELKPDEKKEIYQYHKCVLGAICMCYHKLNKCEEEKFYLKELMLLMKTSGEQVGAEFASIECKMAQNYLQRGKRDKAMKLCQEVMEKLNGMEEYNQIEVMSALSSSFLSFGEFEKADDLLDKLCKLISRVGYDSLQNYEHFTVMRLKCECEIERPNASKDKLTEALEIGKSALSIAQSFLPSESFEIFDCKLNIARCNKKLGNMETCIEQLKEMRKVEEANMSDSHYRLCDVISELGGIHVERGDLCEALTCYKEALELYQQEDTSHHVDIANTLMLIGTIYCNMGNITDAVKHLEQSIEIREQKQLSLCREAGQCYVFLGACHLLTVERQTTFEQTLQGFYQAQEAYTKSLNILLFYSNCDQEILEVLRDLATLYDMKIDEETIDEKATMLKLIARKAYTWRDYARAKDLFYMQMKVEAATMVVQPVQKAIALHDIGLCQIRLSQLDEAEETFTESLRIAQSLRPEEHQSLQISYRKNLLGLLVGMLKYFRTLLFTIRLISNTIQSQDS
ncbi:uncharacterized protein LOC134180933 [Corticium candelabrum]|uniref:uncharacterized protein LOC134180933 n=1 Tax=Corticium candelabrum TaxID=121492 RepID=UPI002E2759E2|nr:uncharacterized protein LOC134180933 [Corticium candelabrum]